MDHSSLFRTFFVCDSSQMESSSFSSLLHILLTNLFLCFLSVPRSTENEKMIISFSALNVTVDFQKSSYADYAFIRQLLTPFFKCFTDANTPKTCNSSNTYEKTVQLLAKSKYTEQPLLIYVYQLAAFI